MDKKYKQLQLRVGYSQYKHGFLNPCEDVMENNIFSQKDDKNNYKPVPFYPTNPTPNYPIHIAHIRGAVLGDVIASILESNGFLVTREYYVNDSGSQIEALGNSLYKRYKELLGYKCKYGYGYGYGYGFIEFSIGFSIVMIIQGLLYKDRFIFDTIEKFINSI